MLTWPHQRWIKIFLTNGQGRAASPAVGRGLQEFEGHSYSGSMALEYPFEASDTGCSPGCMGGIASLGRVTQMCRLMVA